MTTSGSEPAPAQPPLGTLRLHLQGNVLTRTITPSVAINGQWVPVSFGVNDLPVYAGPLSLFAQTQWLRTYGQAELSLTVEPQRTVEVWYVPPMHQFTTGSMGFEKQKSRGKGVYVAILAFIVLVILLLLGAQFL